MSVTVTNRVIPAKSPMHKLTLKHRQSKYRGVCWTASQQQWYAQIGGGSASISSQNPVSLGWFDDEIEAAKAYDAWIRRQYGVNGLYNFPREGERSVFCDCCPHD